MRKILTLLTTIILGSTTMSGVTACGTRSPSTIAGKTNVSVEFTLRNPVIVTDDEMLVEEAIFNQAKDEGKIGQELLFTFFEVTDSEAMVKPDRIDVSKEGYVVFTTKNADDTPYTGSITVRFKLIKKVSIDISQDITLEKIEDVTKYAEVDTLYRDIWNKAVVNFKEETPRDFGSYTIEGFELPTSFNEPRDVTLTAKYNGLANTLTKRFSGTITINCKIISYRAEINLNLQHNNLERATLYDLVWKKVEEQFEDDNGVSTDYNDYKIDWMSVVEPSVGESTAFNFLAEPNDESFHHYIRVVGTIVKEQITLPETVKLSIPILVTEQEKEKQVSHEYIWRLAMQEIKLAGGTKLDDFNTTNWHEILQESWPTIGQKEQVTLKAINLNTNPMFKADIEINLELINQGTNITVLNLDRFLLDKSSNHDVDSVLALIWNKIINSDKWSPYFSQNFSKFNIPNYTTVRDELAAKIKKTNENGEWIDYGIQFFGSAAAVGRDLKFYAHGWFKMINEPIKSAIAIDLGKQPYQFMLRKMDETDNQTSYLVDKIWSDIIKNKAFVLEGTETFGISKVQTDWNYRDVVYQEIDKAINNFDEDSNKELTLDLSFRVKDKTSYDGKVNVQVKLTPAEQIRFEDIILTNKASLNFISYLPADLNAKRVLIAKIVKGIIHFNIKNNAILKSDYPEIPWEFLSYDTDSQSFIEQFEFPTELNPQQELRITFKTISGQLFNGSVTVKIKLIYQPIF